MGLIRVLLAIGVLMDHSGPIFGLKMVGGDVVVQLFFIISGFYMTLILNEKYKTRESNYLFYSNRLLRLVPIYAGLAILIVILSLVFGAATGDYKNLQQYVDHFSDMAIFEKIYLIGCNIVIFGQDALHFMGIDFGTGKFFFSDDFKNHKDPLYSFLLMPQSWTLAIEFMFYAIAPFILRRKLWVIVLLISLSITGRIIAFNYGYYNDPWSYRFFPFELANFLIGSISYQFYLKIKDKQLPNWAGISSLILAIASLILIRPLTNIDIFTEKIILVVGFALLIPIIFSYTRNSKLDNIIGEFSYPVYLSHILVISAVTVIMGKFNIHENYLGFISLIGSLGISYLLIRYIADPIEVIRKQRVKLIKNKP